jgi:hypothetical protein
LLASAPILFESELNRIQEILVVEGLGEKLHGPAFMARTVIGTSLCAVMKMIGI